VLFHEFLDSSTALTWDGPIATAAIVLNFDVGSPSPASSARAGYAARWASWGATIEWAPVGQLGDGSVRFCLGTVPEPALVCTDEQPLAQEFNPAHVVFGTQSVPLAALDAMKDGQELRASIEIAQGSRAPDGVSFNVTMSEMFLGQWPVALD
jgi:hypothetical protein